MKLFVATDVHGSAYWAERVAQKFNQSNADLLILLGDVYNHGPRNPFPRDYAPMKVAELFNGIADKVIAVQGNCDSEVDQMISQFPFVKHNVIPMRSRRLFFTHGHQFSKYCLPPLASGDAVFYGHFHTNEITDVDGIVCVNVSSVALPKDQSAYCIVDDGGITLYSFDDQVIMQRKFD